MVITNFFHRKAQGTQEIAKDRSMYRANPYHDKKNEFYFFAKP